ncbi:MAG: hypothetical protein Q7R53_01055 [bacterium]|nr:hypothetical protein [bacterium]
MKKLIVFIMLVLVSGISLIGCGENKRSISEASGVAQEISRKVNPTPVLSLGINPGTTQSVNPIVSQPVVAVSQKSSLPPLREPLNIQGIIKEDRWSSNFKKTWSIEHEFAQDIYQKYGAFTVRVKLTNISGETLPAQKVALVGAVWINQKGGIASSGEIVVLNTVVNLLDYPYAPIKPGQTITLEPFERFAGKQIVQEWKSYEVALLNGGGSVDERLIGNFTNGFYKETASAKEKIAVIYKAGISPDGKLKVYVTTNNPSKAVITGKVFFNWLDDEMNPLGTTEVRSYSTRQLPYYLLSTSELDEATSSFEFSTAFNSGAKSYEFWIEVADGK